MVTISRQRSGSTGRKQMALVYLLIGTIILFSFNAFTVPDDNLQNNKLRGVPKRNLDEVGSIELDVDNAILAAAAANSNDGQLTTTAALEVNYNNKIDAEESSIATTSSSPTEANMATTTAATVAAATTTITTATTIPIRDMIHKRSQEVKQLLLDQFSGSSNSPPNPRYHQSLHTKKKIAPNTSCSQDDAFVGIPIDNGKQHHPWVPNSPGGYPREALIKWKNAFNAAMKRIREEASGGDVLREFAEAEVKQLRKLRHSLFCKRE